MDGVMNQTSFTEDIKKGKIGEKIFKEDFISFLNNYFFHHQFEFHGLCQLTRKK